LLVPVGSPADRPIHSSRGDQPGSCLSSSVALSAQGSKPVRTTPADAGHRAKRSSQLPGTCGLTGRWRPQLPGSCADLGCGPRLEGRSREGGTGGGAGRAGGRSREGGRAEPGGREGGAGGRGQRRSVSRAAARAAPSEGTGRYDTSRPISCAIASASESGVRSS